MCISKVDPEGDDEKSGTRDGMSYLPLGPHGAQFQGCETGSVHPGGTGLATVN